MDLKWVISEEERTRHDALFYSQKPQDRYLSGKRSVFSISAKFIAALTTHLFKYFHFQENRLVLYSFDPNFPYRSSAKSGLYDFIF